MSFPQPPIDAPAEEWLVYGDALQEANDPRGELIALTRAAQESGSRSALDEYTKKHAAELLGGEAAKYAKSYEISWRWCLIEGAKVRVGPDDDGAKLVEALLNMEGMSLSRLSLVGLTPSAASRVDLEKTIERVIESLPESCKTLELIDLRAENSRTLVSRSYDPGHNLVQFGDLEGLWQTKLEHLRITTADPFQINLGTIDASNLRSLELLGLYWQEPYGDSQTPLAQTLTKAKWPNLESLRLRLPETWTTSVPESSDAYVDVYADLDVHDDYDDDEWNEPFNWVPELGPLLASLKQTKIRHLALMSFDTARTLLQAIEENGLPDTLRELDLSISSISNDQLDWFRDNQELLSKLELLDLTRTLLADSDVEPLKDLGPQIKHFVEGFGGAYRFVVGME